MSAIDDTKAILGDLIAFPTVSVDSNLALIAYCAAWLAELGAKTEMSLDPSGTKANLFATIGPRVDGGIVLSGHTDVVPVEGQEWTADPFQPVERDGRIYGRGSCDMKGFIACALAMAPMMSEAELKRPIHFALTYDEEVGCVGAQVMLDAVKAAGRQPAVCIIGEPTGMRVIEGHKGMCEYTTRFTGLAGHGSRPERGVSAVEYAVRYVARLLEVREELRARAPGDSRFEPPWSTLQVGRLAGGIAHNVIADHADVDWELRPVNNSDYMFVHRQMLGYVTDMLLPAMQRVYPEASIGTEVVGEVPGLEPMPESEACELVTELTGGNVREVVSFGTEAGLYQKFGISTVVCGPGSIAQAHKADEFIAIEQLEQCLGMIERLVAKVSR
ncbi:MAG TPA: acetylornithine deacetylase [Kiloniellales bacterium]|nr:acetylornithine deacetylase [Kiloniellales bacterium]